MAPDTAELIFEGRRVSKQQVLGRVGQGVKILMSGLDYEGRPSRWAAWHHEGGAGTSYCLTFMKENNLVVPLVNSS